MEALLKHKYYNSPDGEDFFGKMVATNKYMVGLSIPAAAMDVLLYSHPKGALATIARFSKWIGPAAGMASIFTVGTYAACTLRGKDDKLNYVVGACGAAGVFGKAIRSPTIGFQACVLFSLVGIFKKISVEEGWNWFPTPEEVERKHVYGTLRTAKYDYSIMKDTPEKGWTSNPAEA